MKNLTNIMGILGIMGIVLSSFAETASLTTVTNIGVALLQNNVLAGANITVTTVGQGIKIASIINGAVTNNQPVVKLGNLTVSNLYGNLVYTVTNLPSWVVSNGQASVTFGSVTAGNLPTLAGVNVFNNLQSIVYNYEYFGCNNSGATTTLTANNEHGYRMFFPNYSGTGYNTGFLGLDSPAQSTTTLDLGAASAPASPGVSQIFFDTGPTYNVNATRWWTMDSSGDWYPYQSNPTYTLGLAISPVYAGFFTSINSATVNAATALNAATATVTNGISSGTLNTGSAVVTNTITATTVGATTVTASGVINAPVINAATSLNAAAANVTNTLTATTLSVPGTAYVSVEVATNSITTASALVTGVLTLSGLTNYIVFGQTNVAPAKTNAVAWISVRVAGLTNGFRIPLMQ